MVRYQSEVMDLKNYLYCKILHVRLLSGAIFLIKNNKINLGSKLSVRYGAEEYLHHTSKFFGVYAIFLEGGGRGDFGLIDFQ
jgi:hypothetical protein